MMDRFLGRFAPYIFAILRIVAGFLFAMHGSQKLLGFPSSGQPTVALGSLMGVAGLVELVCGVLIALGLFGSYAAFIASGEMAFAYFMAHAPGGPLPILNKGEPAVLFCFLFLYIAAHGSGVWSIDSLIGRKPAIATA
jgi:putative oxidoreductase